MDVIKFGVFFLSIDNWQEVSTFLLSVHMKAKFQKQNPIKREKSLALTRRDVRNTMLKCLCVIKNRTILCILAMLNAFRN